MVVIPTLAPYRLLPHGEEWSPVAALTLSVFDVTEDAVDAGLRENVQHDHVFVLNMTIVADLTIVFTMINRWGGRS